MRIGVIGAGHAGVEAAWQARQRGAEVVLFSGETVLPYFRPRVVALAFGQVKLDGIYLRPEPWYREHNIDLRLNAEVTQIDASARSVAAGGREERFDALIIATGAAPALLPFLREFPNDVMPLWGVRPSLAIRERLGHTRELVILGGGISGVESALYARQAGLAVTIVERMDRPMSLQFGVSAGAVLVRRLEGAGIRVLTGRHAAAVARQDGRLRVTLDDATELPCDLIITTAGTTRRLAVFQQAGLPVDKGILVDEHLQTAVPGVFACGDVAQRGSVRTATVVRASQQGRCAGDNAVAFLQGRELACTPEPVAPLLFKHADLELQSVGPSAGDGLEEKVLSHDGQAVYRSVLLEGGVLRGVQMVGSRDGFRQLMDALGRPWQAIEPPPTGQPLPA
jgi:3-phenylpropionate/trans-cinnamate dioxygenase ferredoxin reductase subunit